MKSPLIIHTADPLAEIWQRLRLLTDASLAFEQVMRWQPQAPKGNAKKQAEQIGYCIRQAEEYFRAAGTVSLPTKPLLLYYGASSLGQALVLLKQDGEHSLDYLRSKKKHRHHGLELVLRTNKQQTVASPRDFLEGSVARLVAKRILANGSSGLPQPLSNPDVADLQSGKATFEPWGAFALFYQTLEPAQCVFERVSNDSSGMMTYFLLRPSVEPLPIAELLSREITAAEVLSSLPDLYSILPVYRWRPEICRGSQNCSATFLGGQWAYEDIVFLDGLDGPEVADLSAYFKAKSPGVQINSVVSTSLKLRQVYDSRAQQISPPPDSPRLVDDLGGRVFHPLKPGSMIVEPAAMYILLFQLGMLARYYPDIWMHKADRDVSVASLVTTALGIIQRKFPLLMLDQLFSEKHVITQ